MTILIASPLVGVVILAITPRKHEEASSEIALVSSGLTLFIALVMFSLFDPSVRFSFTEFHAWLPAIGASYRVGVDGLSATLILAVSFTAVFVVLILWKRVEGKRILISLLLFETALIGFFASMDIFLMYIFMEAGIFFLGASVVERGYPAKFVGFMAVSSLLILINVILLMVAAGTSNFAVVEGIAISGRVQIWMLSLLMAGVFCRMGLFPFHGWVRDLLGEAKGSHGPLLTGLSFISGAYLFYRFLPPLAVAAAVLRPTLCWIVIVSIIISALIAISQEDFATLFVYIFMAHFGFVLLGLVSMTPQGFAGSGMQMIGLIISLAVLAVVSALFGRRGIDFSGSGFRGAFAGAPVLGLSFLIIILAMTALPGLSHFPGLFMIWMGLFKGSWILALVSLVGVVFVAAALIRMVAEALYNGNGMGERQGQLSFGEAAFIIPFVIFMLAVGIFPDMVLQYVKQSTEAAWAIFSQQI